MPQLLLLSGVRKDNVYFLFKNILKNIFYLKKIIFILFYHLKISKQN
jgi:hypothetical protein